MKYELACRVREQWSKNRRLYVFISLSHHNELSCRGEHVYSVFFIIMSIIGH